MGDGFAFFDIIFFAMVAAFVVLRLRKVLGRRTGTEKSERWTARAPEPRAEEGAAPGQLPDNVTRLPGRADTEPAPQGAPKGADVAATPLESGLTQIKLADSGFDPRGFADGARGAFEMIVAAFARGDAAALRPLLADDVHAQFATAIRAREAAKQTHETTLVGIRSADIVEARMTKRTAIVTVKFVSEQVNVTRNADASVAEGDPTHVATITDLWTFSRDTSSRDPNWTLVATSAQN